MKLRMGVLSSDRSDALKIRESFSDMLTIMAKNVLELYQINGNQPLQGIIFIDSGELKKEFRSYHAFLRSKQTYSQTPLLLISKDDDLKIDGVVTDSLVRSFSSKEGFFLPVLNFVDLINSCSQKEPLSQEYIRDEFQKALNEKLGQNSNFKDRIATDDETHSSFFAQKSGEISSNLIWIKFSVRILDDGSHVLRETFKTFSDTEIEQTTDRILTLILNQFEGKLKEVLRERGALYHPSIDKVNPQDRILLIKGSKSRFLIFESDTCNVLLEEIRYV